MIRVFGPVPHRESAESEQIISEQMALAEEMAKAAEEALKNDQVTE